MVPLPDIQKSSDDGNNIQKNLPLLALQQRAEQMCLDTDLEQFMADICSDTYRRQVNRCVGHAYDEKCAPVTQPCYYSWDPDAYCNPAATPFPYDPAEAVPAPRPAVKVFRRRSWTNLSRSTPPATPYPTSTPTTSASG